MLRVHAIQVCNRARNLAQNETEFLFEKENGSSRRYDIYDGYLHGKPLQSL